MKESAKPTLESRKQLPEAPSYKPPLSIEHKLGQRIATLRTQRGLTQEQLADADYAGLNRSYISDLERGTKEAGLNVLFALAQAFEMTISELTKGIDE